MRSLTFFSFYFSILLISKMTRHIFFSAHTQEDEYTLKSSYTIHPLTLFVLLTCPPLLSFQPPPPLKFFSEFFEIQLLRKHHDPNDSRYNLNNLRRNGFFEIYIQLKIQVDLKKRILRTEMWMIWKKSFFLIQREDT